MKEERAADSLGSMIAMMLVVLLAFLAWLFVRIVNCIVMAFIARPRCKALWIALATMCLSILLAYLTDGLSVFLVAAVVSFVTLAICAKVVLMTSDPLFQKEYDSSEFMHDVMHNWWPAAA